MNPASLEMVKIIFKRGILPGFAAIIFLFFIPACISPYGIYHRVEAGETLADLENIYGVPAREILQINELPQGTKIRPGQRIFIPGADRAIHRKPLASYESAPAISSAEDIGPLEDMEIEETPEVEKTSEIPGSLEDSKDVAGGKPTGAAEFRGDLIWPIQEKNQTGRYYKNDSLIIKATQGTEVLAASSGIVIYLERGVAGYGNMIIVDHNGKMQAVYGGLGDVKVKEGEKIRRGEEIGTVGPSLTREGPALIFEVRVEGELARPIFFLP